MPTVARSRVIGASTDAVWSLVSDPHNLPRWWPETTRIEDVEGGAGSRRSRFTQVMTTSKGRTVRADFRCTASTSGERIVWEQQLEGTPFAKHLKRSQVEIELRGEGDGRTAVAISSTQTMRGLSRLGGAMLRRAQGTILDEALDGLEEAVG